MSVVHHRLKKLPARGGHLLINGRPLLEIVRSVGGTPAYVYDRDLVEVRIRELRDALPSAIKIHYAVKANPMPALNCMMANLVDGFDVASKNELLVAMNTGMDPRNISFAGPGKTLDELRCAAAAGVVLSAESITEMRRLAQISTEIDRTIRVILRLNPDFQVRRSGMAMSGFASQFGIDVSQIAAAMAEVRDERLDIMGFQVFAGSQNLNADALVECNQQTFRLASDLSRVLPNGLRYLNIGGGFGIPYFEGESSLDLGRIATGLENLRQEYEELFETVELVVELGRFLVGEAGFYVVQVSDIKISRDTKFVIVNGGLNHHLANSGNLGQVIRKNYPLVVANKMNRRKLERVTVVGPLCTPLDIVGAEVELPVLEIGDLIAVLQSGAYGYSASPQNFLGHPEASEILV